MVFLRFSSPTGSRPSGSGDRNIFSDRRQALRIRRPRHLLRQAASPPDPATATSSPTGSRPSGSGDRDIFSDRRLLPWMASRFRRSVVAAAASSLTGAARAARRRGRRRKKGIGPYIRPTQIGLSLNIVMSNPANLAKHQANLKVGPIIAMMMSH